MKVSSTQMTAASPPLPHDVVLSTLFYSILMLISNFSYLFPICVFVYKRRWIYVPFLTCTFLASTYYHICFENTSLPGTYTHVTPTYTIMGWLFYDQFKCYALSAHQKTMLILLDYVFANSSTIAGLIVLFPLEYLHPNSESRRSWEITNYKSTQEYYDIQCYDYWTSVYPNFYRNALTLLGLMMNVALFAILALWSDVHGITVRSKIWIMNAGTFLFLFGLILLYAFRIYMTYITHPGHEAMTHSEFISLLWKNVFKRYYTTYFHWKWLVAALSSAFVGLIIWTVLQRVLADHHYIWVHPLWHFFSSTGILFLAIAFKRDVACAYVEYTKQQHHAHIHN